MIDPINIPLEEAETAQEGYWRRVIVALDQFLNVVFDGLPDETMSTRIYRASLEGRTWGIVLNWLLCRVQSFHGARATAGDLERSESIEKTERTTLGL